MRKIALLIALLFAVKADAQQSTGIQLKVAFSKPLAVLQFVQSLSARARPNPLKTLFDSSEFRNAHYSALVAAFDSLPLDYEYDFPEYPQGKIGGSTLSTLRRNLVLSKDLADFRDRSIGLIPLVDLLRLTSILKEFTPVYEKVVYDPVSVIFNKQLAAIDSLITEKNIAKSFTQTGYFYRSQWDPSIPFLFVFYPLPNARGFSATAFGNVSMSALPTSYTDFSVMLSLMLHEAAHILFDEESLEFKKELDEWAKSNPSKYSPYAFGLLNEAWATAIGNGYFHEKLTGKLNPGSWYGFKYNDQMAKAIFPFIKQYLDSGRQMDKALVDKQIEIYETKFPDWIYEWDNLMQGRTVMSDNKADFDVIDRKFPYRHVSVYLHDFSSDSFEKLANGGTKLVIIHDDNQRKLNLVKSHFPSLAKWKADVKKDFAVAHTLPDKTMLIVVNLVKTTLDQQLSSKLEH